MNFFGDEKFSWLSSKNKMADDRLSLQITMFNLRTSFQPPKHFWGSWIVLISINATVFSKMRISRPSAGT
jgi:hypothetical protein